MVINFPSTTPFGDVFEAHSELIRAAVERAALESAAAMGGSASHLFSIEGSSFERQPEKKAA